MKNSQYGGGQTWRFLGPDRVYFNKIGYRSKMQFFEAQCNGLKYQLSYFIISLGLFSAKFWPQLEGGIIPMREFDHTIDPEVVHIVSRCIE